MKSKNYIHLTFFILQKLYDSFITNDGATLWSRSARIVSTSILLQSIKIQMKVIVKKFFSHYFHELDPSVSNDKCSHEGKTYEHFTSLKFPTVLSFVKEARTMYIAGLFVGREVCIEIPVPWDGITIKICFGSWNGTILET